MFHGLRPAPPIWRSSLTKVWNVCGNKVWSLLPLSSWVAQLAQAQSMAVWKSRKQPVDMMNVKFPGRFNAQCQWIQHMALTLNISSIMTMKMFVLLLDGVKTANIQAPADSFEWWRHQESCWAGREASRQSVTQTERNSFLHIQDPRARNDGQGVRSIQYFHHITMEILSIYSALIMHIISALDLGIMEIEQAKWCWCLVFSGTGHSLSGREGGVQWWPLYECPLVSPHHYRPQFSRQVSAPHPALAPSIDLSGVWV